MYDIFLNLYLYIYIYIFRQFIIIIGAFGTITPKLEKWPQQILRITSEAFIQKSALVKVLRKTLNLLGLWQRTRLRMITMIITTYRG